MAKIRMIAWALVFILGGMVLFTVKDTGTNPAVQSSSVPGINTGGPFTLTSHTGARISDTDFRGRYMLVYFGYSFCPDVCPLELVKMTTALHTLEEEGLNTDSIAPLFITFDPERDTPEQLAGYVPAFHPRLMGLTGTVAETTAAAKAYRVYFSKRESDDLADYLMDHLSVIFLMDKQGDYMQIFTARDTPDDIASALRRVLRAGSS